MESNVTGNDQDQAAPAGGGQSAGGELVITLAHPAAAYLYKATSPRVRIDGDQPQQARWGTNTLPVTAGRRRVSVWVPYAIPPRAGRAHTEVTVAPGERVRLHYLAPTVTFLRGSIGRSGQQRSAGWSAVMTFNVAAVVAVVLVLLAWVLR